MFKTWFPYLATLFLFIWVKNLISYIPLPVDTEHKSARDPGFTLYAATSNLSVTLALTLVTFFASHYVGIRHNGAGPTSRAGCPPAPGPITPVIAVARGALAAPAPRLAQRPAVREHARGPPADPDVAALVIIIGHCHRAHRGVPVGVFFYVFEVVLVAKLQAFIFALLSGIYIGTAVEPPH